MFRKAVSLIVMLGFVIGQLAVLPHAHAAGFTPVDHNSRPHIHVSCLSVAGHSHEGTGHHHHGSHPHHHHADGTNSPLPVSDQKTEHDGHDSDALYLPSDIGVSLPSKSLTPVDNFQVMSTFVVAVVASTTSAADCSAVAFFPDKCSPTRPLYLALRALRI